MPDRPNFLLITTDQQRWDCLGCYGNPIIQTPHLDRIAARGIRFDSAYCQNPLCMPARMSILTGRYVRNCRMWCNGVPGWENEITLPGLLSEEGYETVALGKMHFTPFGHRTALPVDESTGLWKNDPPYDWNGPYFGFEQVQLCVSHNSPYGHYGKFVEDNFADSVEKACGFGFSRPAALGDPIHPQVWKSALPVEAHSSTWLGNVADEFVRRDHDRPWFTWLSFPDPHHPCAPPPPYCDMYDPMDMPDPAVQEGELSDKPPHYRDYKYGRFHGEGGTGPRNETDAQIRHFQAHTYGMISLIDDNVGRVLKALKETGQDTNTVVMFTTDHGDLFGDHGLLFKGPFMYDALTRVPFIIRIPELGRHGEPAGLIGAGQARDELVGHVDITPTIIDLAGVEKPDSVEGRSLLPVLRRQAEPRRAMLTEFHSGYRPDLNIKTIHTPEWILSYYPGKPYGELYDRQSDPHQFVNLYDKPELRSARDELIVQLLDELCLTEGRFPLRMCHA